MVSVSYTISIGSNTDIQQGFAHFVSCINTGITVFIFTLNKFQSMTSSVEYMFYPQERQQELEQEGQPDDDGWITVGKHGKNKGIPRTEAHEKRALSRERKRKKEKVGKILCT